MAYDWTGPRCRPSAASVARLTTARTTARCTTCSTWQQIGKNSVAGIRRIRNPAAAAGGVEGEPIRGPIRSRHVSSLAAYTASSAGRSLVPANLEAATARGPYAEPQGGPHDLP